MSRRLAAAMALWVACAGCAARHSVPAAPEEILFGGTLQELVPHRDGDHLIYRATVPGRGAPLQVEHLSAFDTAGDFVVNMSEDGTAMEKQHLRDDGSALLIVSEELLQQDLIIVYEPPLPSLAVPLGTRPRHVTSAVSLLRGSDGAVVARGRVEQTVTASRAAATAGEAVIEVHTERVIQLPDRVMQLTVTTWLTPGIGEVRSEGTAEDGPGVRRELLCALVAGKRVGDKCDQLGADNAER